VKASERIPAPILLGVIALFVLAGAVFHPILGFEFVDLDTPTQVTKNPHIQGLTAQNVKHVLTSWCVTSYYPIRTLTYAIDYQLWGLNPAGFKLTNALIHLANVLLVYWLILRLFRRCSSSVVLNMFRKEKGDGANLPERPGGCFAQISPVPFFRARSRQHDSRADLQVRPEGSGVPSGNTVAPSADSMGAEARWEVAFATCSAGLFAIHPVVVEPVAWVPGREELLMTLGALGCFHFHLSARRAEIRGGGVPKAMAFYIAAAFCCALACLSNAVGAVIPLLIVAWDLLTPAKPKLRRIVWGTSALWLISAITIVLKRIGDSAEPFEPEIAALSFRRLWVVLDVYWLNLKTLVWPTRLSVDYPRAKPITFADWGVIFGLLAACVTIALLWRFRRRTALAFGIAWFVLALAPTSQIIPHHMDRADRFLYLPLVGLAVALAAGLRPLARLMKGRGAAVLAITCGVAGLLVPAAVSARHIETWRNSLSLWQNCVDLDSYNALANRTVADYLSDDGHFDRAVPYYERALELDPDCPDILNNYALRLATSHREELRDCERAIRMATQACDLTNWQEPKPRRVLSMAYMNLATAQKNDGQFDAAVENYNRAIEADPGYDAPLFNQALLLSSSPDPALRRPDEAVRLARQACDLLGDPHPLLVCILAEVYANVGRFDEATDTVETAIRKAHASGQVEWMGELERRLESYRKRIPFRDSGD
jgi:tetratricopeptide (TPR) repeat protein